MPTFTPPQLALHSPTRYKLTPPRPARALVPAALAALLLTSCAAEEPAASTASAPASSQEAPAAGPEGSAAASPDAAATDDAEHGPADVGHIHGLHPDGDRLLIATHHGLFVAGLDGMTADGLLPSGGGPAPRGPLIDLMGFTASADALYASGHPGEGTDLPNPVGLLKSTDDGATWEPLSRTGQSDFHALTTAGDALVGFDGALVRTEDGTEWENVDGPDAYALAGHPDGQAALATTPDGLWVSDDAGRTWAEASGQPDAVLQFVAFADADTAVGIAPDGSVHVSEDAGASWEARGTAGEAPSAIAAEVRDGQLHVWAAASGAAVHSDDGGATFK